MPNMLRPSRDLFLKYLVMLFIIHFLFNPLLNQSPKPIRLISTLASEQAKENVVASTTLRTTPPRQITKNYIKSPLFFEMNQGQVDSQVRFLARGLGFSFYLTPSRAVFTISKPGLSSETNGGSNFQLTK